MKRSTALVPGSVLAAVLALAGPATSQTPSPQPNPTPPSEQGTQQQGQSGQQQPMQNQGQSQGMQNQGQNQGTQQGTQSQGTAQGSANADPRAVEVANRVLGTLGGKQAWDSAHFFRFTFAGRRRHYWDKWTGRHRLEGQTAQGQTFVVLSNLNTKEGQAFLDGQPAPANLAPEMIKGAYAAWVNDTYWLLMPYKLQDPGVNLGYQGTETIDGQSYDVLTLSFKGVGMTPGDRYWVYVNKQSSLVDRWGYVLQNQPADSPQTQWLWQGWTATGPILLAPKRTQVGGEAATIEFTDLAVLDTLPDTIFTSPAVPGATGDAQPASPGSPGGR
ncbi:MAG TPA: hypothetical protein VHU81_15925 [Thermoanaerobaculia bacterium]|nr:hypothetical protein [Thermoanaerobaculia bacterium]